MKTPLEILNYLKEYQKEKVEKISQTELDERDVITLYHGTTSKFLNDILKNGLQPRSVHSNSMYEDRNPSNEKLVYLTNYFQYRYAFSTLITNKSNYEEKHLNAEEMEYDDYYEETGDVPMILTLEVPKSWLIFDEDIAYFREFSSEFRKDEVDMESIDWEYSMQQYTCASFKAIPPEFIKKVDLIAYYDLSVCFNSSTNYAACLAKWANGWKINESVLEAATEELLADMFDNHLGAFEEFVPSSNEQFEITYKDSCVFFEKTTIK